MDNAVKYVEKLDAFVAALNKTRSPNSFAIETGRKFDKVFEVAGHSGRYMIDRNSWIIYGIKSWAQHNPRREFGTLDTVAEFDWSGDVGKPIANTPSAIALANREAAIASGYKKRGRPKKVATP